MDSNQATASNSAASSGSGGSPWDDELDVPKTDDGPKTIGTLEPKADNLPEKEEQPVPFNIPKDISEQVGKKIPASSIAADDQVPAAKASPVPAQNTAISKLDPAGKPIVAADISAPAAPAAAPTPSPIPSVPTPKPNPTSPVLKPQKKRFLSGIFAKKNNADIKAPVLAGNSAAPTVPPVPPQQNPVPNSAEAPATQPNTVPTVPPTKETAKSPSTLAQKAEPKFAKSGKPPFYKKPVFLIVSCAILLLVVITFLTESGVISVGLENVYGTVGLDSLWGGLPKNPEKALAIGVANNKNHPNFKIMGSMSLTVNKTIKSDVTSPLVSMISLPVALRDSEVGKAMSAVLAQYQDYYSSDPTATDSTTSGSATSDSTSSTSTSTSPSDSTSSGTSTNSSAPTSTSLGDQSQYPSYTQTETTIKQLDFSFSGTSGKDATSLDVTVKKLVGADSKISLINSKNDLYVKTGSDIKFDPKADPAKWLDYKINSMSDSQSGVEQFFGAQPDQNFSIIGSRVANEKVGSVRCYNYQIDKLEVGSMFENVGIKSEMIQKINGNIWIGVSDHLIHKIDLIIIPSISSSVTRAEINLELSSYDVENGISVPSLTDKIDVVSSTSPATTGTTPAASSTTTPSITETVPAGTAEQNDTLRKSDLAKIKGGLEAYKQKYGKYPVSSALLHLNTSGNIVEKAIVPTFIDAMPADPKAADGWYYAYTSDGKTFKLSARFENLTDPQITKSGDIYLHYVYNN